MTKNGTLEACRDNVLAIFSDLFYLVCIAIAIDSYFQNSKMATI